MQQQQPQTPSASHNSQILKETNNGYAANASTVYAAVRSPLDIAANNVASTSNLSANLQPPPRSGPHLPASPFQQQNAQSQYVDFSSVRIQPPHPQAPASRSSRPASASFANNADLQHTTHGSRQIHAYKSEQQDLQTRFSSLSLRQPQQPSLMLSRPLSSQTASARQHEHSGYAHNPTLHHRSSLSTINSSLSSIDASTRTHLDRNANPTSISRPYSSMTLQRHTRSHETLGPSRTHPSNPPPSVRDRFNPSQFYRPSSSISYAPNDLDRNRFAGSSYRPHESRYRPDYNYSQAIPSAMPISSTSTAATHAHKTPYTSSYSSTSYAPPRPYSSITDYPSSSYTQSAYPSGQASTYARQNHSVLPQNRATASPIPTWKLPEDVDNRDANTLKVIPSIVSAALHPTNAPSTIGDGSQSHTSSLSERQPAKDHNIPLPIAINENRNLVQSILKATSYSVDGSSSASTPPKHIPGNTANGSPTNTAAGRVAEKSHTAASALSPESNHDTSRHAATSGKESSTIQSNARRPVMPRPPSFVSSASSTDTTDGNQMSISMAGNVSLLRDITNEIARVLSNAVSTGLDANGCMMLRDKVDLQMRCIASLTVRSKSPLK